MRNPRRRIIAPACGALLSVIIHSIAMPASQPPSPNAALLAGISRSDPAAVRIALQRGAKVDVCDAHGRTALRLAVEGGRLPIVKLLLARHAEPFLKSSDGETAVSRAVTLHRHELWKAILAAHGGENYFNLTPSSSLFYWAVVMDDPATARALLALPGGPKSKEAGEALAIAAGYGRAVVARVLIEGGVDVNFQVDGSDTPLMAAAGPFDEAQIPILKLLLAHGANVHASDREGWTPLMHAARNGSHEAVKLLLAHGAAIEAKNNDGQTAETLAHQEGRGEIVAMLERARTSTEDAGARHELALAVEQADLARVQALLAAGGDVNARDDAGLTLLVKAVDEGQLALVKLLLEHGADVHATSLRERYSALFWASEKGRTEIVVALIAAGARVDDPGPHGTPLMRAAEFGHLETVQTLLDHGAAVNGSGASGGTALENAAAQGHLAIVRLLLERGAQVNDQGREGSSALTWAAANGWADIVRLLLAHGAGIHGTGPIGDILWEPARQGHAAVVKELLEHGVAVNGGGEGAGNTPLMTATQWGQTEVVAVLIAHGADVNRRDRSRKTALDYALEQKDLALIALLRKAGARE